MTLQPEVGVYPKGNDPNILFKEQIQAGTLYPQGPNGPLIPNPRPTSFPVTQTPRAPQQDPSNFTPVRRKGISGSHQIPGPGNYNPPADKTPSQLPGQPGSGQQLIKHYLLHQKDQQTQNLQSIGQQQQKIQQHQQEMLQHALIQVKEHEIRECTNLIIRCVTLFSMNYQDKIQH